MEKRSNTELDRALACLWVNRDVDVSGRIIQEGLAEIRHYRKWHVFKLIWAGIIGGWLTVVVLIIAAHLRWTP